MLSFFHPRPVVSGRAVAVQVVRQTARAPIDANTVLVLASRPPEPPPPSRTEAPQAR